MTSRDISEQIRARKTYVIHLSLKRFVWMKLLYVDNNNNKLKFFGIDVITTTYVRENNAIQKYNRKHSSV